MSSQINRLGYFYYCDGSFQKMRKEMCRYCAWTKKQRKKKESRKKEGRKSTILNTNMIFEIIEHSPFASHV